MRLVLDSGAHFVWGLQPIWFSKTPSAVEQASFDRTRQQSSAHAPLFEKLPFLYSRVLSRLEVPPEGNLVDVHSWFSQFGSTDTLFVDHAHTNPAGDEEVAGAYFSTLIDKIVPSLAA